MQWVVLDFETASACDLTRSGAWRYAEDPTTEVLCLFYSVNGEEPLPWRHPDAALQVLAEDPETFFIAHNAAFEKAIWRKIMVPFYNLPDVPNSRWHDTMAACAYRHIPLGLDDSARVLALPHQKDAFGSTVVREMSKPYRFTIECSADGQERIRAVKGGKGYYERSPEVLARVERYCPQDVRTEVALHRSLGALPAGERNVWLLDQRINERGVRLDMPFVQAAREVVAGASAPLLKEFTALTGGLRPSQRDRFMEWIASEGYRVPNLRKETLVALLGDVEGTEESLSEDDLANELGVVGDMPDNVRRALEIRQLVYSASIKKLHTMQECVGFDGRARGLLVYHGAGPGRWTARLLQPQNFPRGTLLVGKKPPDPELVVSAIMTGDYRYVEALFPTGAVETVVSSLRHTLIPGVGRHYVVGDFAGIEARLVLALAGQHDKCDLMASGADVYIDMALDIYNMPKFDVSDKKLTTAFKEEHSQKRTIGKNSILGCGFQMWWPTFKRRYCPNQSDEFAERVVTTYRKEWAPKVPNLWRGLERAACDTVWTGTPHEAYGIEYRMEGEWLTCRLLSGRKLWYFHPEPCRKVMPWSTEDNPDVRPTWRYYAQKMGRWTCVTAFGGLLTENVIQALARDLLVEAMFKCENNGLPVVLTVHDEIVCEPLTKDADRRTLEHIMQDSPAWARAIKAPISAECWAGERYKK